jgi:hypothetical protein
VSGPTRWRDDGPQSVRDLLRHAPKSRSMTAEQRSRTSARVARLAALPLTAGMLFWVQSVALGAGLGVATLVVAAKVVPGWVATSVQPLHLPAPSASWTAAVPKPPMPLPSEPDEPAPIASSPSASPPPPDLRLPSVALDRGAEPPSAASSGPARNPDSLSREAELLEQARAELGGNPAEALRIAQKHASLFPNGKLSIERELVAVDALQRLGRAQEARARGDALLARSPGSLYEQRIRRILGADRK